MGGFFFVGWWIVVFDEKGDEWGVVLLPEWGVVLLP
jgi:hypothetical protein